MVNSRRHGRELALQVLYQCDTLNEWLEVDLKDFCSRFSPQSQPDALEFASILLRGVVQNISTIDSELDRAATNWPVSRMTRIDRNVLRIAAYELAFEDEIPPKVSINEAVELSKLFGTEESHLFVNGVLDKVGQNLTTVVEPISEHALKRAGSR